MRIIDVVITPIAVPDVPLANTKVVHPSVAVIEVKTDTGLGGLGEAYGAARSLTGLQKVAPTLAGPDPHNLRDLYNKTMVVDRDDTDEMLKYIPDYVRKVPRW